MDVCPLYIFTTNKVTLVFYYFLYTSVTCILKHVSTSEFERLTNGFFFNKLSVGIWI